MHYHVVIGLEIHIQLATKSKLFSSASTQFGAKPNSQASIIDLGLPGVLPILNLEAIKQAIKFGLAVDSKVSDMCIFDRKNYFYPDLPKGYQISQQMLPILMGGNIKIGLQDDSIKTIRIHHAHLEEDAGKSIHHSNLGVSAVDLNRAGQPLLEIVSEPDIRNAHETIRYLKTVHSLVRYLDICDGNMQEGSFRCDVNISLRKTDSSPFGTKVELKNLNSFKFIEKAIEYEIKRQSSMLDNNESIIQETRLYDEGKSITRSMREKEDAHDYRYFPDPDIPPISIDTALITAAKASMPELPWDKSKRFQEEFKLSIYDAQILTSDRHLSEYYEKAIKSSPQLDPKTIANWVCGPLMAMLNKSQINILDSPISEVSLTGLLQRIEDGIVSTTMAKAVLEDMWEGKGSADEIIESKGLKQISNKTEIMALVKQTLADNPQQLAQYKSGKDKLFGYFVGQIMKKSQGKADPKLLNSVLKELLSKS